MSGAEAVGVILGIGSSVITIIAAVRKIFDALKPTGSLAEKFRDARVELRFLLGELEKHYDPAKHDRHTKEFAKRCLENANRLQTCLASSRSRIARLWREKEVLELVDSSGLEIKSISSTNYWMRGMLYNEYKDDDSARVYKKLEEAVDAYSRALTAAKNARPAYTEGIIRVYISLADCHREQSHDHHLRPSEKLELAREAGRCLERAIQLAEQHGDETRAKRARLEDAVLRARKLLIKAKDLDQFNVTKEELAQRAGRALKDLVAHRNRRRAEGDRISANWAGYWAKQLEAM
ncbi:hypothetical protein QBC44DRAFT_371254 [Cladorrhinum sp. PSN332]|nr:hypothetical protein QBC44DRAFT_371254 [Cladorrhinum sp. PSN332]